MEEIEILSWITLDAIKKTAEVIETVGNLQTGHTMSVFCKIDEDYLELCYSDTASNFLRRFEDREELNMALETRKEETGDAPYDEDRSFDDAFDEDESTEDLSESEDF
ncbi:MAG: hypothetical protein JXB26_01120 [Candidatus Aminicenantes bacterium]|nr:hypothetical protein [Candidatus Aminicenantes bacterium]